jgi:hypothetical protein
MTATSGLIGGYTIASDRLTNASSTGSVKYAGLIDTALDTGLAFFAGATGTDGAGATFAVTNAGALSASSVSITGGSITIGVGSSFSVTSDGQVAAKGGYFDPVDTGTLFRPAVVVAGNTTQGDIAAAGNGTTATGTLNLGVTTLGATGTAATGQFTNVLQMTKDLITANKTLYIGSASTSTTGLSFKQNRGHIAPFSASDSNNSIGFYTSSSRATFTPVVASAFFPGGNGSSNLGYDGTNLTMNDSLVVTGRVYGTLGIGSTSYFTKTWVDTSLTPSFGTAPTATNMSAGDLAIFNQSGTRRIYADDFSDGVYYVNLTSASDIRLKQNISDYSGGLAKILSMRPVTFNWKEVPEGKTQIGLIAQDLQEIEPSLVDTQDILAPDPRIDEITDGKLLMPDIDGIRALAISAAAIKEMYAEFTALKARVAELENA